MSVRAPQRPYPTKQHLQHVLGASCLPNARGACCGPAVSIGAPYGSTECNLCFTPLLEDSRWLEGNPVATGVVCDGRHVFHKFCLRQWVQTNRSDCPDCRRAMYPSVIEQLGGLPDESADDWSAEDEQLLNELERAMEAQQQRADDAVAAEQRQQQHEQIYWQLVQSIRDGDVEAPDGWRDTDGANPFLDATIGVVLTRRATRAQEVEEEKAKVLRYMPTLEELKAAVRSVHLLFLYLDARPNESDAWAYSWQAGDLQHIPYNHFAAINFMESNERMVDMATALIARLQEQVRTTGRWTPAESQFAKNWMIAWKMLARLRDLNTHARIWSEMRQEYGEWADPRER